MIGRGLLGRSARRPFTPALLLLSLAWSAQALQPNLLERARTAEKLYTDAIAKVVPSYVMIAGGSGVVISAEGLMLTNHHVIDQGYQANKKTGWDVRVGSKFFKADILGTDPHGDITLLKIKTAEGEKLPPIDFADSDQLVVGQQVIAVGNPFSTMEGVGDPTVTVGVISALHRFQDAYSDAIQTDAPINPGNSGGPLLTMEGRLAGINGRIQTKFGARANTGIGLAIPTNQIKRFLPALKEAQAGLVHHAELRGLRGESEEKDGKQNGAEVKEVVAGSQAAKIGFLAGDRITHVEDMPIMNFNRLFGIIGTYPAESEMSFKVNRQGKTLTLKSRLDRLDRAVLGFTIQGPHSPGEFLQLQAKLRQDPKARIPLVVEKIDEKQPAAKSGLQKGDEILAVAGEPVENPIRWQQVLGKLSSEEKLAPGAQIALKIKRGAEEKEIQLTLGSGVETAERKAGENGAKKGKGGVN